MCKTFSRSNDDTSLQKDQCALPAKPLLCSCYMQVSAFTWTSQHSYKPGITIIIIIPLEQMRKLRQAEDKSMFQDYEVRNYIMQFDYRTDILKHFILCKTASKLGKNQ